MGPYPFALAAALVAALLSGLALGTVRLSRLSLGWWRAFRSRRARGPAGSPAEEAGPAEEPHGPPGPFPRAHGAVAAAALAALVLVFGALVVEPAPGPSAFARAAGARGLSEGLAAMFEAGGPLGLLGFALLALALALGLALLAAALDRAVHGLAFHLARRETVEDLELSLADLRAGAEGLWARTERRGEPFGVGLGYVALFASPVAALALLLASPAGRPDAAGLVAFGAAFLVVPLAYAAAAERSQREDAARLRRRAAVRQLVAAPVWLLALTAGLRAGSPGALGWIGLSLALALPFALPGSSPSPFLLTVHRGGDLPDPSPSVRALTGLAHHAWVGAWALLVGLVACPRDASPGLRAACALMALAALVLARALLALGLAPRLQRWALLVALPAALWALASAGGAAATGLAP